MVDYKILGGRIKGMRRKRGMTQEFVAEKADITVVYLSKIENGHVRPTIDLLSAICEAIDADLGELFIAISPNSPNYQNEQVVKLFNACSPTVKPIAIDLLKNLSKL